MSFIFKGKGLFIYSDPGAAKAVLAQVDLLKDQLNSYTIISDREYSFATDFNVTIQRPSLNNIDDIERYKPDFIFTGTSYRSDIEKKFIQLALQFNIPCISYIDHWTGMRIRFLSDHNTLVYPTEVWVVDEHAKILAIESGIDKNTIIIAGNPYHNWLKKWKPSVEKKSFLSSVKIKDSAKKILLYAPDPLSNTNGKETYGFDELSATSELVKLFNTNSSLSKEWLVLVKAHPNQNVQALEKVINNSANFILVLPEVDTNTCIFFADKVLGFVSNILIESLILHKAVIRYFHQNISADPLEQYKEMAVINNFDKLTYELSTK